MNSNQYINLSESELIFLINTHPYSIDIIQELFYEISKRDIKNKKILQNSLIEQFEVLTKNQIEKMKRLLKKDFVNDKYYKEFSKDDLERYIRNGQYRPLIANIELHLNTSEKFKSPIEINKDKQINKEDLLNYLQKIVDNFNLKLISSPYEFYLFDYIKNFINKNNLTKIEIKNEPLIHNKIIPIYADWNDTAKLIRNAKIPVDINFFVQKLNDEKTWHEISPLRILGYTVNSKSDLNTTLRQEFLNDFCEFAILPNNIPQKYSEQWGLAGSETRYNRTINHIKFLINNFSKIYNASYDLAISSWEEDLAYLIKIRDKKQFKS